MGLSGSWMAVQGCDLGGAIEAMGREPAAGDPWTNWEFDSIGVLPGGWVVACLKGCDALEKGRFGELHSLGPAVAFSMEEHVMVSEARGYCDGAEVWRVTRDCDEGTYHLAVEGEPPPELAAIRRKAVERQDSAGGEDAGVDYMFSVPADLVAAICGFEHDREPPKGVTFTPLLSGRARPRSGDRPGFFARLFGAR